MSNDQASNGKVNKPVCNACQMGYHDDCSSVLCKCYCKNAYTKRKPVKT